MNNSIAVPNERAWQLGPYLPPQTGAARPADLFGGADPRFPDSRPDPSALALADPGSRRAWACGGDHRHLADHPPLPRGVTLEANPPTVAIINEQSREREATVQNPYDFIVTQVGLLSSRNIAERTAQDLNLANNPDFVAAGRRRVDPAQDRGRQGRGEALRSIAPEEGNLIKFSYDSDIAAAGGADRQRHRRQLHQFDASAPIRSFGLRPQVPRAADRQDPRATSNGQNGAGRLRPGAGDHQHRQVGRGQARRRRRQFASGRIADRAQPGAGRRDRAPRRGRGRLSAGRSRPARPPK